MFRRKQFRSEGLGKEAPNQQRTEYLSTTGVSQAQVCVQLDLIFLTSRQMPQPCHRKERGSGTFLVPFLQEKDSTFPAAPQAALAKSCRLQITGVVEGVCLQHCPALEKSTRQNFVLMLLEGAGFYSMYDIDMGLDPQKTILMRVVSRGHCSYQRYQAHVKPPAELCAATCGSSHRFAVFLMAR